MPTSAACGPPGVACEVSHAWPSNTTSSRLPVSTGSARVAEAGVLLGRGPAGREDDLRQPVAGQLLLGPAAEGLGLHHQLGAEVLDPLLERRVERVARDGDAQLREGQLDRPPCPPAARW